MKSQARSWVRALWVTCLLLSLAVLIASLPGYFGRWAASETLADLGRLARAGTLLGISLSLIAALLSVGLACLLFWKKSDEPMALYLSFLLLLYGILLCGPWEAFVDYWIPHRPDLGLLLQGSLLPVPIFIMALIFPNGRFVPRWTPGLAPLVAALQLVAFTSFDVEETLKLNTLRAQAVNGAMYLLFFFALGIQAYRYRKLYTPVERQQTRWVIYGAALWAAALVLISFPYYYRLNLPPGAPSPWWTSFVGAGWWLTLNILPLSITLAITRSGLWAIDVIIRRTLVYGVLSGTLALFYFGSVVLLQQLLRALTGQGSSVSIVLSTLGIAALFTPLRRRVQHGIDRSFYRKKYDAAQTLAEFGATARDETDLEKLSGRLVEVVQETMQPEDVSLWLRATDHGPRTMDDRPWSVVSHPWSAVGGPSPVHGERP